jgi:N-acetylglutamate synthase-like GNAT family acetyltransferase
MIREFKEGDAQGWCDVISENLLQVNSKDYPKKVIAALLLNNTPKRVLKKAKKKLMLVAENEKEIVGTASLTADGEVKNLFVKVLNHGNGVGSDLLKVVESRAKALGFDKVLLYSSVSAVEFYEKNGYKKEYADWAETNGKKYSVVLMTKII